MATKYTLKDLARITYHFGMNINRTVVEVVYDPVVITDYIKLHHYDSIHPCVIIEPASDTILYHRNGFVSERYTYDSRNHKIIPH